ncbi:MAG: hypothetical protein K0U72_02995 [Gammaproteobacteria bacterium]|nr:hypothetical protein [Gammaproteobacteria bacterium]
MINQILTSVNQSFRLVFQSILKGIRLIITQIGKVIDGLAKVVRWFHGIIAKCIQLIINLSSLAFIIFVPFAFLVDPLGWSSYLYQHFSPGAVFWGRMILGCFFLFVAYLVVVSLWKTIRQNAPTVETEENKKKDFVQKLSGVLSWLVIGVAFLYFTVFRYQLVDLPFSLTELGNMIGV